MVQRLTVAVTLGHPTQLSKLQGLPPATTAQGGRMQDSRPTLTPPGLLESRGLGRGFPPKNPSDALTPDHVRLCRPEEAWLCNRGGVVLCHLSAVR